ncbi:MAG: helix-turn-helix domain-containing protein [Bacteroidales bacterium]|nr:helix-turn-helix domain-containing protein [Bacteroidales bacterium]
MYTEKPFELLVLHLKNIALLRFQDKSVYQDIISPFSRIYLITSGSGSLQIGNQKIELESGYLYLIPRFINCSYTFEQGLEHYYIHLSVDLQSGLNPYQLFPFINKKKSSDLDLYLFKRILDLNPNLQLPHHHPDIYQKKPWLNRKVSFSSAACYLETTGILKQIFSRFIEEGAVNDPTSHLKYNIQPILLHIQQNLGDEIKVQQLQIWHIYQRSFFKIFKSVTGYSPNDFVISKRIERAQFLLLTTDYSQKKISDMAGVLKTFHIFQDFLNRKTNFTPDKYRKQRG